MNDPPSEARKQQQQEGEMNERDKHSAVAVVVRNTTTTQDEEANDTEAMMPQPETYPAAADEDDAHGCEDDDDERCNEVIKENGILLLGFSVITFVLAVLSIALCKFIANECKGHDPYDGNANDWNNENCDDVGLFGYDKLGDCTTWTDTLKSEYFDTAMIMARAFGVLAAVTTGLAMVLVLVLILVGRNDNSSVADKNKLWRYIQILYVVAVVSQPLVFVIFASSVYDATEHPGIGLAGILAGVNVFLLFTGSFIIFWKEGDTKKWIFFLLSLFTFVLAVASIASCRFATDTYFYSRRMLEDVGCYFSTFGLFGYEDFGSCTAWTKSIKEECFDFAIRIARGFGVLAAVSTGLAMVLAFVLILCNNDSIAKKSIVLGCIRICHVLAFLSQSLTFVALSSEVGIEEDSSYAGGTSISIGGLMATVNALLLLIAIIICIFWSKRQHREVIIHQPEENHGCTYDGKVGAFALIGLFAIMMVLLVAIIMQESA